MKKLVRLLLGLTLTSLLAGTCARAQYQWTVDENGPAVLGGLIAGYANGSYKIDPVSGLTGWYYALGPSIPGDVPVYDEGTSIISDLIRFDGNGVFFFSLRDPGDSNPSPADVPQLPTTLVNVGLLETANGAFYRPQPGRPGFDASGVLPGLTYQFISDVREPSSIVLLFAAGGVTSFTVFNSKRRA